MAKRILVPIDFSTSALDAIEYAIETFPGAKRELIVVHVVEPIYFPGTAAMSGGFDMGAAHFEIDRCAREQLAQIAARLRRRRVGVRTVVLNGSAAHAVVECAKKLKADLIVMSTHGRTGLSHILLGSVAEGVVRHAACPVVIVRGQASTRKPRRRRAEGGKVAAPAARNGHR